MNIYAAMSFLTSMTVFFWGAFVFSKDTKNKAVQLFLLFSFLTAVIAILEYLYINSHLITEATLWLKYHILGWPILYVVQLNFLLVYANFHIKKQKLFFYTLYTLTFILVVYVSFTNTYATLDYLNHGWIRVPANISKLSEFIFAFFMTSLTLAVTYFGIRYRLKASGRVGKLRAYLVLAGILIPTWVPFFKNAILPGLFDLSILFPDSPFIFVGWAFLAIAIFYFKMFDINPRTASDKILSTMNEALLLANIDGKVVWANDRFYELFELDDKDIDDEKFDLLNLKNMEAIGIIDNRYKKEELKNLVVPITTFKNNQIYVGITTSFLMNEFHEASGVVTVMNDVSELIMAQQQLKDQQKQMLEMAHQAGMSEVTTSVMHNIGNILNSVNVSSEFMSSLLSNSKLTGLIKANEMMSQHQDELTNFLTNDPKGQLLPDYYQKLGKELQNEHEKLKSEGDNLLKKIKLIKDAIDLQQDYSRVRNLNEPINLNNLIDEVITILQESFKKNNIVVQKEYDLDKDIIVMAPSSKLINVFLNIVKNASESMKSNVDQKRIILIKINTNDPKYIQVRIKDNGIGITKEVMPNIFKFGFTTKQTGHGYGLHFCGNVLKEMNGSISASSEGYKKGAEFRISIPKQ